MLTCQYSTRILLTQKEFDPKQSVQRRQSVGRSLGCLPLTKKKPCNWVRHSSENKGVFESKWLLGTYDSISQDISVGCFERFRLRPQSFINRVISTVCGLCYDYGIGALVLPIRHGEVLIGARIAHVLRHINANFSEMPVFMLRPTCWSSPKASLAELRIFVC